MARNRLIAAHLARLEEGLARTQEAVASLRDLLMDPSAVAPVHHRRVDATMAAAITDIVGIVPRLGRVAPVVVQAAELAVIVHTGSHADVDRSYGALAVYVTDDALQVDGPIREYYLVGRHDTPEDNAWRTEIGWPIFSTGAA